MLDIDFGQHTDCDGISRRDFLRVGGLSALGLTTSTPGMTVQVYGANGSALPQSITDTAWVKVTPNVVERSKHLRLVLKKPGKAFRWVSFWISRAPAASVGTPQAPGHVSVNELELFPAR